MSAQVALSSGTTTQTFDDLGAGLPPGWSVYTGATATGLGNVATPNLAVTSWGSSTGQWANFAAANGFTGTEAVATQSAATHRALGIRQTGTFGDPGASANFYFSTLGQQVTSISFSAEMLSVQTRSTAWSLQYGIGATPSTWTTIATYSDPGVFGSTTVTAGGFGSALDNQSNVWLRIVALAASTGSGSRDTFGINDFTIVAAATGDVPPNITSQPSPQSVPIGGTATFTVAASGTAPLTYQWKKGGTTLSDGGNISGAQTATLTITNVSATDVDAYSVVVNNATNSPATSNAVSLTIGSAVTPTGQLSYTGGSYIQNFDTLPASGTFTLGSNGPLNFTDAPISASGLGGWSLANYGGTGTVALFRVDAGAGTSGSVYSYGTGTATERALGSLSSGSTISRFGTSFVNNTGLPITQITLSYTGEQWRFGGPSNHSVNTLKFEYAMGATSINTGTFTAASSLDFVEPVSTGASAVSLDGNQAANRVAVSSTITGLNWGPGETLVLRWSDVNDSGNDDGLAIDDLTFSTPVTPDAIIPSVAWPAPGNNSVNVAVTSAVSVTFNEAVNVTGSWFSLVGSLSGAHTATVTGGPTSYTLQPDVPFAEGETVTLTISAAQVTDAATGAKHPGSDYTSSFITFSSGPLPLHTIQGLGVSSQYAGSQVSAQGIVVASFQGAGQIGGYYIEAPDAAQDANPATSEGIYVFDNTNAVNIGDLVTVTGTVDEFGAAPTSETEIKNLTAFAINSSGNALPTAATVNLPFANSADAERYEGMLVTFPQSLTVTNNFDYGHFGELVLSHGRLSTPTNVVAPGAPAQALEAANKLNQILVDDGQSVTNPDPTPYLNSADPAVATRRTGSTTSGITGILDNRFGGYVLEPTATPVFVEANPRANSPASTGSLRVVIGNVENFMNGDGAGGGFPTSRGATTFAEYQRQLAKVTAGILNLAPDIMGLTEIENDRISNSSPDSYGPTSAIAQLVDSLNASAPAGTTYAFVNAAAVDITTDVIHVALIYRKETVEEVGTPAMLSDVAFNNLARNPLAQTFRQKATGGKLTVCINHWRAKGGAAPGAGNTDSGDGQGTNNALRVQEADATAAWLATNPTGDNDPDVLLIGDLNAYAKEDPLTHLINAGYTSLTERFEGEGGYSYQFAGEFGHLDHALATSGFNTQVLSAATWHVNSDEPVYYDYNVENKSAAQQAINVGTPYRYSDHDPVVIGVNLTAPPTITVAPTSQTGSVDGGSVTLSVSAIGFPGPTYQWRKDGAAIDGATNASLTFATPHVSDSGSYDVVITNAYGSVTSDPVTLTINPATASISLSDLEQLYDGTARPVSVTTSPAVSYTVTYDGSTSAPIYPGAYAVVATSTNPDYVGSASDTFVVNTTALVRHAPSLSGGIGGSLQLAWPESTNVNSAAWISGDFLVPGKPTVVVGAKASYGGTVEGIGAASPTNYSISLSNGSVVRHVVRRVDAVPFPTVSAPPAPTGTRSVTLNSGSQSIGDFTTLRDLTLNSGVGQIAVPPGTYGSFTANKNSGFTFGSAGAQAPAIYNLQNLTINSAAQIQIVGPVIINLANGTTIGGNVGTAAHAEWLELNVASGGITLNGAITFAGIAMAPSGTVALNSKSTWIGRIVSDHLTINGSGVLEGAP
jgi:predicted extracellular nuclease